MLYWTVALVARLVIKQSRYLYSDAGCYYPKVMCIKSLFYIIVNRLSLGFGQNMQFEAIFSGKCMLFVLSRHYLIK